MCPDWTPSQVELVTGHLGLAERIARRYLHRGVDEEDLLQVARTALVEASQRFDPERGDFAAFAAVTVSGVIKKHFRDHGWSLRPARPTQELAVSIWRRWPGLVQELGRFPDDQALAADLGVDVDRVREAQRSSVSHRAWTLDAEAAYEVVAPETSRALEAVEARLVLRRALRALDDDQRDLIRMRFVEERSQADIAGELGTTQMQVSRRLARILVRLRGLVLEGERLAA